MRLFLVLGVLVGSYAYLLMKTTDTVIGQTQQLSTTYQQAGVYADRIAAEQ